MFTASKLAFTSLTSPRPCTVPTLTPFIPNSSSVSRPQFTQFNGRHLCLRRRLFLLSPKATADQQGKVGEFEGDAVVDSNVLPYCSIDKKQKKSVGELEQEFLQALQSFYYEGKAIMSNEEFDILKEELMWEGSSVVMLSSDEQKFLEASMAYVSGKPILTDKEYDQLKLRLKVDTAPFKQWYLQHYGVEIGRKKKTAAKKDSAEEAEAVTEETKKSNHVQRKLEKRQAERKLDAHIEEQFGGGRLLACISSRPGQCGRADGYILEVLFA